LYVAAVAWSKGVDYWPEMPGGPPLPIRPNLRTALAVCLGLVGVSLAAAIALDFPGCSWGYRIPRNAAQRVAAALQGAHAGDARQREEALRVMADYAAICPRLRGEIIPVLTGGLRDPDEPVRLAALEGLVAMGDDAKPAIRDIEAMKGRSIRYVDYVIAEAVWYIRRATPEHDEPQACAALTPADVAAARAISYPGIPESSW
jgi:hypothetical protein